MSESNQEAPIRLAEIDDAIQVHEDLPHVKWERVAEALADFPETDWNDAYWGLVREWLYLLAGPLSAEYATYESKNFAMLLPFEGQSAARFLQHAEDVFARLRAFLGQPVDEEYGPHVVILFDDIDDLARYIAPFHPEEGEFHLPLGTHVAPGGFGHIVLQNTTLNEVHAVLAHELAHDMLGDLDMPTWLREGAANVLTRMLAGRRDAGVHPGTLEAHREYWSPRRIQRLWSGAAFDVSGESELSRSLADILCKLLAEEDSQAFQKFVRTASLADGGEAAAHECFGHGLSEPVERFLGPTDWEPDPSIWPETDKEIPEFKRPETLGATRNEQSADVELTESPSLETPPEQLVDLPRVRHKGWFAVGATVICMAVAIALTPGGGPGVWIAAGIIGALGIAAGYRSLH